MMKNLKMPDFSKLIEYKESFALSVAVTLFLSYFFYHNFWMAFFLSPLGYLYYRKEVFKKEKEKKEELRREFKEMIVSISGNLQAGYAVENAFVEAKKDMILLFGEESQIVKELTQMNKGIRNGISVEELIGQFGKNSEIEEIKDFAAVFSIAKRTGGNLVSIIRSTTDVISKKIEVQNDILTMISGKLFEQKIMNLVPFGIVFYISFTSPGFFDPMYGNLTGAILMTVCLGLYVFAYFLSQKMIQIKI